MFVVDAHWIDGASESQLAELLTVIPHTGAMVLVTARPDYDGTLRTMPDARTISLRRWPIRMRRPCCPSCWVRTPRWVSCRRSSPTGPPATRSSPRRWCANWRGGGTDRRAWPLHLPRRSRRAEGAGDELQATIEARIDRLTVPAKRTLSAASVIGARF